MKNIIVKQIPIINNKDISKATNIDLKADKDYIPDGVKMINAPFMWSKGITGKDVKIAVIDSGCDMAHKDLQTRIIAASNNYGVIGVAPDSKLLILKALDKNGSGSMKGIIDSINFAINQRVDIISMSLGTSEDTTQLRQAIKKAVDSNILVVCAAGNEGDSRADTDKFSYPAGYNEVISVGAVDYSKSAARFSNFNKEVDLVAPGVNIISTFLNGKYETLSGTSMATPHVTGALALLIEWSKKEFGRKLTEAELYGQLIKNTDTLPMLRTLQGNGFLLYRFTVNGNAIIIKK